MHPQPPLICQFLYHTYTDRQGIIVCVSTLAYRLLRGISPFTEKKTEIVFFVLNTKQ